MRSDLDRLLQETNLDVLWVLGEQSCCPDLNYLTRGAPLSSAWVILRQGREPLLCHSAIEREGAAQSGCRTLDFNQLGAAALSKKLHDPLQIKIEMFERLSVLEKLSGRMSVHGIMDAGEAHALLARISDRFLKLEIVRDAPSVLEKARLTKDESEIEQMKQVAVSACEALEAGLSVIRKSRVRGDALVDSRGNPVTVGRVRAVISRALAERGLQETVETILSIGREAGIPHANSVPETVLAPGRTVVLDLFPRRRGGGYFFDITRSFCIAYAPDPALGLYEDVLFAQGEAMKAIRPGMDGSALQELVCDLLARRGHPTLKHDPETAEGYVHSLGHGVGLEVHERPFLKLQDEPEPENRLLPGTVFTIEPGLYYPDRGMGLRLEDTVYLDSAGKLCYLAEYEKSPVLELESA